MYRYDTIQSRLPFFQNPANACPAVFKKSFSGFLTCLLGGEPPADGFQMCSRKQLIIWAPFIND